jgi:hypothetical protein
MPRPTIPEHIQAVIDTVTPDMTDDDIERLAGSDGRLLTTLLCQREELRDPLLRSYGRAFDRWHALLEQHRDACMSGTDEEIEHLNAEMDRAHATMSMLLHHLEMREARR